LIHPALVAAAEGTLPPWAEVSAARREHLTRVAELMESWARTFQDDPGDVVRWRAAAMLHDALRDAPPDSLRARVEPELRDLPEEVLHGPAAARSLRNDGVRDQPLLLAVAWHTAGHPDLDRLGRALYLADHLEPGRPYESPTNAQRRQRVTHDMDAVLRETAAERIARLVEQGRPLLDPTVRFWNGVARV
jgi:HD superfamily phosphohydrolase YqeK